MFFYGLKHTDKIKSCRAIDGKTNAALSYFDNEFDSLGRIIRRNDYNENGELKGYGINHYDDNGRVVLLEGFDKNNNLFHTIAYEYDELGRRTKYTNTFANGHIDGWEEIEYQANNVVLTRVKNSDGEVEYSTLVDFENNISINYDESGILISKHQAYTDEKGRPIKSINGFNNEVGEAIFTDTENATLKKSYINGNLIKIEESLFDEKGRTVALITRNPAGALTQYEQMEYDEMDNIIKYSYGSDLHNIRPAMLNQIEYYKPE